MYFLGCASIAQFSDRDTNYNCLEFFRVNIESFSRIYPSDAIIDDQQNQCLIPMLWRSLWQIIIWLISQYLPNFYCQSNLKL